MRDWRICGSFSFPRGAADAAVICYGLRRARQRTSSFRVSPRRGREPPYRAVRRALATVADRLSPDALIVAFAWQASSSLSSTARYLCRIGIRSRRPAGVPRAGSGIAEPASTRARPARGVRTGAPPPSGYPPLHRAALRARLLVWGITFVAGDPRRGPVVVVGSTQRPSSEDAAA